MNLSEADRKLVEDARLFVSYPKRRAMERICVEYIEGLLAIINRPAPVLNITRDLSLEERAALLRAIKGRMAGRQQMIMTVEEEYDHLPSFIPKTTTKEDLDKWADEHPGGIEKTHEELRASVEVKDHPHLSPTEPFSGEFTMGPHPSNAAWKLLDEIETQLTDLHNRDPSPLNLHLHVLLKYIRDGILAALVPPPSAGLDPATLEAAAKVADAQKETSERTRLDLVKKTDDVETQKAINAGHAGEKHAAGKIAAAIRALAGDQHG
jgi:hypothetical protein